MRMSQLGVRPTTISWSSFEHELLKMIRRALQDVRLVCLDDREDLKAESLHNNGAFLGFDKVSHDVGLAHVE